MSTLATVPKVLPSGLRQANWQHPEWWALAISAAAWGIMLLGAAHSHAAAVRQQLFAWMVMTVAMMLPTVAPQMRWTAQGSFWHRRHRAIAGFVAGYLVPWLALGLLASLLLSVRWMHAAAVPVGLFLLATGWQQTTMYRSARRACHRTIPLTPLGWRADRDCLRYGLLIGTACVRSCWPLMLACAFTGHGLVAMTVGCLLSLLEGRSSGLCRPSSRLLVAGTLGLALYYGLLWVHVAAHAHSNMRM